MSETIYTQQGKLVVDSSFIPYIRKQDVVFEAENLRPGKVARLFLDDIAMNHFSQKANKILINSSKILNVSTNSGDNTPILNDYVYQGSSNDAPIFSANIVSYSAFTQLMVINKMAGNFDPQSPINIESSGILIATANVNSHQSSNTADLFYKNEGIICQNNGSYMEVIGSSGENVLYVNENFITLNIAAMGANDLSTMTVDYKVGDVIFQTPQGNNDTTLATFLGKVVRYDPSVGGPNSKISIAVISGALNVNASTTNTNTRIWNSSNSTSKAIQPTNHVLIDMGANNILRSVVNTANSLVVTSYVHNSGTIANVEYTTNDAAGSVEGVANVYISSSNASIALGNIFYFTTGAGIGQFRRILEVDGKRIKLNSNPNIVAANNLTKYSIGNHIVDENGNLTGIINIPEEPNFKFRTGERIFTITDVNSLTDNDYTMRATSKFVASGLLNKTQNIITTPIAQPLPEFQPTDPVVPVTPSERTFNPDQLVSNESVPSRSFGDPIAQTFFTPKPKTSKINNGMFVTSVDLFFGAKPSTANGSLQLPISVKIATVVNGFPTQNYIAISTVQAKDVKISDSPSSSNTSTYTKFTFPDPVYLLPDSEYALVVYSESPEYEVYIAELGGDVLGADPPRRISEQPYAGSFFRSQNSSTWTPYQNEDLMFVINKAEFQSSGSVTFNLKEAPTYNQDVHRLFLHTNELTFPVGALDYKVRGILKGTSNRSRDFEPSYNYVKPHTVFRYGSLMNSSNKIDSTSYLNSRELVFGNANSVQVVAEFTTSDTDVSPIFNKESFSLGTSNYRINNAELANSVISITSRGVGYNAVVTSAQHTTANAIVRGSSNNTLNNAAQLFRERYLANNFNIGFYNITISGGQGIGADGFAVANTDGTNKIDYIVVNSSGYGYIETPSISLANGNATTNVIASAVIQGETGSTGGNIECKYITRQFTLEDGFESGDMRVFMDVVRPTGTDVQVYYKVLGAEDPQSFTDKTWVRMHKKVDRVSKDEREVVQLEFRPNLNENILEYVLNGIKYPIGGKYKSFAIKVALTSTDATIIPMVKNIRAIASPEG